MFGFTQSSPGIKSNMNFNPGMPGPNMQQFNPALQQNARSMSFNPGMPGPNMQQFNPALQQNPYAMGFNPGMPGPNMQQFNPGLQQNPNSMGFNPNFGMFGMQGPSWQQMNPRGSRLNPFVSMQPGTGPGAGAVMNPNVRFNSNPWAY